ncbi:MAG: radical SAM protein [bacterium]
MSKLHMTMKIREVRARSILSRTRIPGIDYCINCYTGCGHSCTYCYATFMKKFTNHSEPWGTFVDVKVNAVDLLKKALRRNITGEVLMSSVTDAYQPLEEKYELTRGCLALLAQTELDVDILTKSDLVVRDIDILSGMATVDVGLTITTNREDIKHVFEPASSSIGERINALKSMRKAGVSTYVFIGPILPMDPEKLVDSIAPFADRVLIDRMNYRHRVEEVYRRENLGAALEPEFFEEMEQRLVRRLAHHGVRSECV